jgi:hypothetical protein
MKHFIYIILLGVLASQCRHKEENFNTIFPGKPEVPTSVIKEHENLLHQIETITLWQDSTGLVAKKLRDMMRHHFREEEEYVLPPLGLLPLLASGELPTESKDIIRLTEKLKSQLAHMSAEHQLIIAYMKELKQFAPAKNLSEIVQFEKELQEHARLEEEFYFPTAILIGEYLKLKSK